MDTRPGSRRAPRGGVAPMSQPRPRFSAADAATLKSVDLDPHDGKIECWFKPSDFATKDGGGAWETGVVTRLAGTGQRQAFYISFPTTAGEWSPWPEPILLSDAKWKPGWRRAPARPSAAPRQAAPKRRREEVAVTKPRKAPSAAPRQAAPKRRREEVAMTKPREVPRQGCSQPSPRPGPSGHQEKPQPHGQSRETLRPAATPRQLQRRPWLADGATLRRTLIDLQIPATGRLAGAGRKLVGDKIPRHCWKCAQPDWHALPAELDDDPAGSFRSLRERRSLEVNRNSKPIVIHSPAVAQRYARAVTSIKEPGICPPRYLGRGRKLVIMFDWKDRDKMVARRVDDLPIFINPLDPPADPKHPCWGATCYFVELRADLADTLVIPAGMLHFVLTVEDSTLVCVELSSPLASELKASLEVVQEVRRLQEIETHKRETYKFYDRWTTAGFDVPTMLHKGIELLTANAKSRAHATAETANGGVAEDTGDDEALERYWHWLLEETYCPNAELQHQKGTTPEELAAAAKRRVPSRRKAYEHVLRHLTVALNLTRRSKHSSSGSSGASREQLPPQQQQQEKQPSLEDLLKVLAKAEKHWRIKAKDVDGMAPEWERDPDATERVTLYRTGICLLADDAYNDDRGQSYDEEHTLSWAQEPLIAEQQKRQRQKKRATAKANAPRKRGTLVSGRDAGRFAAARFIADDTPSGTSSTATTIDLTGCGNAEEVAGTAETSAAVSEERSGAEAGGRDGSTAANGGYARAVFFEGFQSKQLATALDVEQCGRRRLDTTAGGAGGGRGGGGGGVVDTLRHGCTSLLVQERGAVTQLHFDTGPYSAISFHCCQRDNGAL